MRRNSALPPADGWQVLGIVPLGIASGALLSLVLHASVPDDRPTGTEPSVTLRVGTKEVPPFATKDQDGRWGGISIDLWRELAADLEVEFVLEERDLQGLLAGLQDGSLDAAVAAVTVTSQREAQIDFTHPFHTSGLGIAVRRQRASPLAAAIEALLSRELLQLVALLAGLQLLVGLCVYLMERRRNPSMFGGPPLKGIGSGFWWSVVTMTTVGYGDKTPITLPGRVVALGWMLCSVVVIATFTGSVASALTVERLESAIRGPADLSHVQVGTVRGTTSEGYLRDVRLNYRAFDDVSAGLAAVQGENVDALVYDAPLLTQAARPHEDAIEILPITFERQDYAIALPEGSPLRERINRIMPDKIRRSRDLPQ